MKFTCLQENLLKGLLITRQGYSRATTLPVLNSFLLESKQGALTVSSTNLEIGIRVTVRGKEELAGAICLPQDLLLAYIRNLPQDKLELTLQDQQLTITQGQHIKADFQGIISEEFPEFPHLDIQSQSSLATTDLKQCLKTVFNCLPKNNSRPEIAGVYIKKTGPQLTFVGTDGFRLSEKKYTLPESNSEDFHFTIPTKTVSEIIRVLELIEDEEVSLQIGGSQFRLVTNTVEIVSKLLETNFPEYEVLIPEHFSLRAEGDAQEIAQAIKLASVFSQNTVNDVKFTFQDQHSLQISSSQSQIGANSSQIPILVSHGQPGLAITFNYTYLLDGIQIFADKPIEFNINDTDSPVIIKSADMPEVLYLIMPIRD